MKKKTMPPKSELVTIDEAAQLLGGSAIRPEYLLDLCKEENLPVFYPNKTPHVKKETVDFIKAKMQSFTK